MSEFAVTDGKSNMNFAFESGLSKEPAFDDTMKYMMMNDKRGSIGFNMVSLTGDVFNTLYANSDLNNEDILKITVATTTWKAPKNMTGKLPVIMTEEGGGKSLSFQGRPRCQLIGTPEGFRIPFSKIALITRPPRENGIHARVFVEENNLVAVGSVIDFVGNSSSKVVCVAVYVIDSFIDVPKSFTDRITAWIEQAEKDLEQDPYDRFARQKRNQIRRLTETKYIGVNMSIVAAQILLPESGEVKSAELKEDGEPVYNTEYIIERAMKKLETTSMTVDYVEEFGAINNPNEEVIKNHFVQEDDDKCEIFTTNMENFFYDFETVLKEYRHSLVNENDEFSKYHIRCASLVRYNSDKSLTFEGHLIRKHSNGKTEEPVIVRSIINEDENELESLAGNEFIGYHIDATSIRDKLVDQMHKAASDENPHGNELRFALFSIF